jgi:hypothetical protein
MQRLAIIYIAFVLVLCATISVNAQTSTTNQARGGSIYSSIGVGFPIDNTADGLKAQGILGISNVNRETSALANPALWAQNFYTQATTGFELSRASVESSNSSSKKVNLQTGFLHLLFPVKPGKVGVSLGLYPVTRASFKSTNTGGFDRTASDMVNYTNEIQSFGGINKLEIGVGVKLTDQISIGYAPSIAFLTLQNSESFTFSEVGFDSHNQEYNYNGATIAHRFGISGTFNNILNSRDKFSFGATLNLPYTIDASARFTSVKNIEGNAEVVDLSNELENTKGDIEMPIEVAFGIGYAPNNFVNLSAEAQVQQWDNFKNGLQPDSEQLMSNRVKFGVGGQYHPYRRNFDGFLSGFKYAAGLSYDTGHLVIEDEEISTFWINSGIGIPSKAASFIDISVRYGFRGTTNNELFKERIWSIGFSVNLTELMFVRPKLR